MILKQWKNEFAHYAQLQVLSVFNSDVKLELDTLVTGYEYIAECEEGIISENEKTIPFKYKVSDTLLVFTTQANKFNRFRFNNLSFKLDSSHANLLKGLEQFYYVPGNSGYRKDTLTLHFPTERIYLGPFHVNWKVYFLNDASKGKQQRLGISFDLNTFFKLREIAYTDRGNTQYLYEYKMDYGRQDESFYTAYNTYKGQTLPVSTQSCAVERNTNERKCSFSEYDYFENGIVKQIEQRNERGLAFRITFNEDGTIKEYDVPNKSNIIFSLNEKGQLQYQGEKRIYDEKNIK